MTFSLIVSTIGRDRELHLLLKSLTAQTRQDFEVIVVDQSQWGAIAAVVEEFSDKLSIQRLPMSQRGASRGRNLGWSHARGDILTFPDDDCTWPPDLLEQVAARFEAARELDGLTTRIQAMSRPDLKGGPVDRHNIFQRCFEAALFFRRERMGDLRYDEQMGVGAGTPWGADEGPDLMLGMLNRGLSIEYVPELCMFHPDPLTAPPAQMLAKTLSYSRGRGYLLRKHRYSWLTVGHALLRSLGGSLLMLLSGRWVQAQMYWLSFWGKAVGYHGGRKASYDVTPIHRDSVP